MIDFEYVIKDEIGIHARPAGLLSKLAKDYKSEITVSKGEKTVPATKLMALMGLGIKYGDRIKVSVTGADEDVAYAKIKKFFEDNL